MGISISLNSLNFNVINIYSSSGCVVPDLAKISHSLSGSSFILGDFNLHHPMWDSSVSSRASDLFVDWLSGSSFCIINTTDHMHTAPNGSYSLINMSLCSLDLLVCSILCVDVDLFDRDHFPIVISVTINPPSQSCCSLYNWSLICRDVNNKFHSLTKINFNSFQTLVHSSMANYSTARPNPSKLLLV